MCIYGNMSFSPGLAYPLLGVISLFVSMLRNVHGAEHIILSGDFNMDRRLDDNPTGTRFAKKGQRVRNAFFDAILDLGFHDCVKKFYPDYIQTYRAARGDYPWQLDHMFATEALYNQLESVHVVADAATLKASDHNPIVAEFKIG